jgi:hypothetical protein
MRAQSGPKLAIERVLIRCFGLDYDGKALENDEIRALHTPLPFFLSFHLSCNLPCSPMHQFARGTRRFCPRELLRD